MALFARANANAALLTNNCYFSKLTSHDVMLRGIASYANKISIIKKSSKWTCQVHSHVRYNVTSNTQKNFIRKCHVVPHNKNYVPFDMLLARRRAEANRSILVQVQSLNSHGELYIYCKQFGNVNGMHHYAIKDNTHFYLVEFNDPSSADAALESATHINYDEVIPVQSRMLWFRNCRTTSAKSANQNLTNLTSPSLTMNGSMIPTKDQISERLTAAETISDQMILLHDIWKLDEVGIRLRFLTAHQLERTFVGLFPHISVVPFGSSVNGFGKRGCDLDLSLNLENDKMEKSSSRFVFHTKTMSGDKKLPFKRLMETIADSLQHLVPGVSNVRRILLARVPIIKYDQTLTGLECDLSMTNTVAVYMAELLCLYGEVDPRVRPLVFTIRQWAKNVGLTNPSPGRSITNFSITLLVLFYLQQKKILPTLNALKSLAGTADIRVADYSADCTFLRDVTQLPAQKTNENTDTLETLLQGFFEYYSSFDFPAKAISLRDGMSIFKPDFSPLYIVNPLEKMLNVSKNVSVEEAERLKVALRNASWIMESANDGRARKCGILSIFEQRLDVVSFVDGRRTVDVKALFQIPNEKKSVSTSLKSGERETRIVEEDLDTKADRMSKMKKRKIRR